MRQHARWGAVGPWLVLGAMVLLYALAFAWLSVARHLAFQSHAFDLGNMDQAVWNTLHGHPLRFTDMEVNGRVLTSRLAIHVEPLLLPIALLYVFHAGPATLLVLQALVVATGLVPAYLLARDVLGQPWLSLTFPAAYALHPSLQNALLDDFHAVTMSAAFLLWALYFLWRNTLFGFAVSALLALSTKEEIGLLVALLGIVLLARRRQAGAVTILAGLSWFLSCVLLIIPHFNPAGHSPYLDRYGYLGHGFGGILAGIFRHPELVIRTLTSVGRIVFLVALLDPLAFLPVVGLPVLLLALPSFAIDMLSADSTMYSGYYQYAAEIVPYLIVASIAAVAGLSRLATSRGVRFGAALPSVLTGLVLLAAGAATWEYGFTPLSSGYIVPSIGPHQQMESRLLARIPRRAVVAAADEVEPHLSDRPTVYLLPTVHPENGPAAQYIALDASIPALPVEPHTLHSVAERALRHGYSVLAADDGVVILRRSPGPATFPASFYRFLFTPGTQVQPVRGTWGALSLLGVTVHPRYGYVNRSRPAIEVETYWQTSGHAAGKIVFYLSPVYTRHPPPAATWQRSTDTPTTDWLPVGHWPLHQTVRVASLPLLPPLDRPGEVDVGVSVSRTPATPSRVVRLATIDVRP